MKQSLILGSASLAILLALHAAGPVSAQPGLRHPALHHALYELRKAHVELREAGHDFGGHRDKALHAVNAAAVQVEKALLAVGDKFTVGPRDRALYAKFLFHPHLHRAVHDLREARAEMMRARHDFGGHRKAAIRDMDYAIVQIELALKHARR
jgi:hypothetical protein